MNCNGCEGCLTCENEFALEELAELFKTLGDFSRIKILSVLASGEMCVCDIAEKLGMGQTAVSHQLRVLRGARLVKSRRDGKHAYYSMCDEHISKIFQMGCEHLAE